LLEKVGAYQALKGFVLIYALGGSFGPLADPAPPLWLGQVHEVCPDRATVNSAGFFSALARKSREVRMFQRLKDSQRIKISL